MKNTPSPMPYFFFLALVLTHLPLETCFPLEHLTVFFTTTFFTGGTTSGAATKFPEPVNV